MNTWIGHFDAYTFDLSYTGQYVVIGIMNFCAQGSGLLALSSDYGATFTSPNANPPNSRVIANQASAYQAVIVPGGSYQNGGNCLLYSGVYISPDGQTIVTYCYGINYSGYGLNQFHVSRDQGVTWTLLTTPNRLFALVGETAAGAACEVPSFTASTDFQIFATTCNQDVFVSRDSGATFTFSSSFRTVYLNAGLNGLFRLVCNSGCTRMAVASKSGANILISTDLGKTFTLRTPGVDSGSNGLSNLAMDAGGFIIIAAYRYNVQWFYVSKDGGTTWSKVPINFSSLYSQYTNMCGMRLSSNGLTLTFATCWNTSPRWQGAVYIDNSYP